MPTYEEAVAVRQKWALGALAELLGFQAAEHEDALRLMSEDPYLQGRFEQGFFDGKAILANTAASPQDTHNP